MSCTVQSFLFDVLNSINIFVTASKSRTEGICYSTLWTSGSDFCAQSTREHRLSAGTRVKQMEA